VVIGILKPVELVSQMDSTAFIGFPIAERYFGFDGHPTSLYLRTVPSQVTAVAAVLPATVNPDDPSTVGYNYARAQNWSVQIPALAFYGGVGAALAIGAIAGLYPAMRAARLSPTEALRTA
jgi:putative ABC transport system permease protein